MCTYLTEKLDVEGSGKGAAGWFALSQATVYLDHPQHAPAEHTLSTAVQCTPPWAIPYGCVWRGSMVYSATISSRVAVI